MRYGAYMLRRFGWFYKVLGLGWLLDRLRMEDHSVDRVRTAADEGPIVYVLLEDSTIDHLALNTVLNKRRLPLSVWANGVTAFYWQPVIPAWRDVARRVRALFSSGPTPDPVESGWLARTVASGVTVTVFLEQAAGLLGWLRRGSDADPVAALLEAQQQSDEPIQLLPVVVVWDRSPPKRGGVVRAFIRGSRPVTGALGHLRNLLFRSREAFVQVGDPVDLRAFSERVSASRQPKALRTLLRRYLRRESRMVRGPSLLPWRDMKRVVLDNPPMRALAQQEAEVTGRSLASIRGQMEHDFKQIAARFRWWVIRLLDVLLQPLWTRVFAGVDIRPQDVERIRGAMRDGTAVLVPSHKSHFDYVLLSWVFYSHDLIVPHIVAGLNLAIWPVSILLRGAGAFFIKRSFTGDRIFPAVFARYLRELLRLGYPVEFFIEGGRSRSGKLLPPKLGVLGMVLDAAAVRPTNHEITLLPISFAYEQVAEAGAYARELAGEPKQPETLGQVVKAGSVLGNRYGRAYVRVGDPIPVSPIVDPRDDAPPWEDRDRREHKHDLQRVGERLVYRIGKATVVLPTSLVALALLAHHRRGIREPDLLERVERFRGFLDACGADEAASLEHFSQAIRQALARLLRTKLVEDFEEAGDRVWAVVVDKRITLEFYKNQVLHFFAPAGYAAVALRSLPEGPFTLEDARAPFADLVWLWRHEFILDPDRPATALLHEGLGALEAHGAVRRVESALEGPAWRVADPGRIGEIYGLFRNFVEAYALVLRHAERYTRDHPTERELVEALQQEGERWLGSAELSRPEALSGVTLLNAVRAFREDRVFHRYERGLRVDVGRRDQRLEELGGLL